MSGRTMPGQPDDMGTLYVTCIPVSGQGAEDITLRVHRALRGVGRILVEDVPAARRAMEQLGVTAPVAEMGGPDAVLACLETGDAMLLLDGASAAPSAPALAAIQEAVGRGVPVVPLPGPVLTITAVAASGLPANGFVYLGEWPRWVCPPDLGPELHDDVPDTEDSVLCGHRDARPAWAGAVAHDRRTLVVVSTPARLAGDLAELHGLLGERPVVITTAGAEVGEAVWRGWLEEAVVAAPAQQAQGAGTCVVVIGGAREDPVRWEEGRVRAEVRALLEQGMGALEVSRSVARAAGWPRRDVYRLVVGELETK